jgi:hypothetical protein
MNPKQYQITSNNNYEYKSESHTKKEIKPTKDDSNISLNFIANKPNNYQISKNVSQTKSSYNNMQICSSSSNNEKNIYSVNKSKANEYKISTPNDSNQGFSYISQKPKNISSSYYGVNKNTNANFKIESNHEEMNYIAPKPKIQNYQISSSSKNLSSSEGFCFLSNQPKKTNKYNTSNNTSNSFISNITPKPLNKNLVLCSNSLNYPSSQGNKNDQSLTPNIISYQANKPVKKLEISSNHNISMCFIQNGKKDGKNKEKKFKEFKMDHPHEEMKYIAKKENHFSQSNENFMYGQDLATGAYQEYYMF